MSYPNAHPSLSPAQQYFLLRCNPVCAGEGGIGVDGLWWEYRVRPTPLSREYLIRIQYTKGGVPNVSVVTPNLQILAGDRRLPHVYRDPLRLCLHLPRAYEWTEVMPINRTFVPWTASWLYYFEDWLACGEWRGGGQHPTPADIERYNRRVRRSVG